MKAPTSIEYGKLIKEKFINQNDYNSFVEYFKLRDNYDNFLSQKPELWQFVPCDADGVPIQKTKFNGRNHVEIALYQQALSKVVFNGWEVENIGTTVTFLIDKNNNSICFTDRGKVNYNGVDITTLESLIPFGVELTDEKAKEFKLL